VRGWPASGLKALELVPMSTGMARNLTPEQIRLATITTLADATIAALNVSAKLRREKLERSIDPPAASRVAWLLR
jgi:hypothetical protein